MKTFFDVAGAAGVRVASCLTVAAAPSPMPPMTPYPPIVAMVQRVDAARLQADDERLVAFGTRNDFSDQTSTQTRGVFAARDWIASRFVDRRKIARTHERRTRYLRSAKNGAYPS